MISSNIYGRSEIQSNKHDVEGKAFLESIFPNYDFRLRSGVVNCSNINFYLLLLSFLTIVLRSFEPQTVLLKQPLKAVKRIAHCRLKIHSRSKWP